MDIDKLSPEFFPIHCLLSKFDKSSVTGGKIMEYTKHAERRIAQRGITKQAIEITFEYGSLIYARGAMIYWLSKKTVQEAHSSGIPLECYEGLHVVVSPDHKVLTAYRNREAKMPKNYVDFLQRTEWAESNFSEEKERDVEMSA